MIQGRWMPQTEEEWQLLEDMHIVTRLANEEGVSKARIASLMAFMSSAAAQQSAIEESPVSRSQSLKEKLDERTKLETDETLCPECEMPLNNLTGEMGVAECPECGHHIQDADLIQEVLEK